MDKINWSKSALTDLESIFKYISSDSKFYAKRQVNKIADRVEILINFPLSGRIVPEKNQKTIRELIEGNYRIFYKISGSRIFVLRIHHSSKKIK